MHFKNVELNSESFWTEKYVLEDWIKENPEWGEAKVLDEEVPRELHYNYYFDNGWVVERNGKKYAIIIKILQRGYDTYRVFKKRLYQEGEKLITRKRRYGDYAYCNTKKHVQVIGETHKNSCQIWAFASLLDMSYDDAYKCLYNEGWRENSTRYTESRWTKALTKLDKQMLLHWKRFGEKKGYSLKNIFKLIPKKGRFLIFIRGHVLSAVDGTIYDNAASSPYCHIEKIFQIK